MSLPPALPDAAAAWGLPGFEQMALARNPTLRQAAAQLEAALSRSFQAGLYPNPTAGYIQEQIGALGESTPTSRGVVARGKPSPGELVGGFVQQEIITGGKLRLSRAKFAEEANAARWQLEAQKLRVLNGVRIRFFEVLAAERLIDIHRELVRLNDDAVRTTEELENVGQANEPDLLQARVEARRARVALRNAENRYRGSWRQLVALVDAPELGPMPLDARLLDAPAAPLDFDATLVRLLRSSPEIQAALAEIRRDQIMVRRERVEPIPNITVQAIAGHNYEFNVTTAGVQASIPLPIFNRNQGTVREAQSDLTRDHAEHERVALSLRERLAEASTRYHDALQSVEDFRARACPRRTALRDSARELPRAASGVAAGACCPADVRGAQPGVRPVAPRAPSGRGGDRRHASSRRADPAGPADVPGAYRVGAAAALILGAGRTRRPSVRGRPVAGLRRVSCGDGAARARLHRPPGCSLREELHPRPTSPGRRARAAARGRPSSTPRRR